MTYRENPEFISRLLAFDQQKEAGETIKEYSNSVEQITFTVKTEKDVKSELNSIANQWLPDYLTNRLVNFDVRAYLQRDNNHTQQTTQN